VDLLILPVIWAAVLIPPWLRRRREGRPAESILTFHRKLWELERTSIYSDAAYSDAGYSDGYVDEADGGAYDEGGFDTGRRVGSGSGTGGSGRGGPSSAQRLASRTALRRRRRIFSGLFGGLLTSLGAAALTGTATAWGLHAAFTLLFVTYTALLVRHHQRVVEQVTKVRYISPIRAPRPAVVVLRSGTGH
jgi:hypothetical protein